MTRVTTGYHDEGSQHKGINNLDDPNGADKGPEPATNHEKNHVQNLPDLEQKDGKPCARKQWGKWTLEADATELHISKAPHRYWIDLPGARESSASCLDWIMQVATKSWITREDMGALLEAIRDLIDPQATLCSWGIESGRASKAQAPNRGDKSERSEFKHWSAEAEHTSGPHPYIDWLEARSARLRQLEGK